MPAGYIIANVDVKDEEAYARYREQVPATVQKYGGEFVVRGGKWETLEGGDWLPRIVVLRFPSVEQARAWYDSQEYAGPKAMRIAASHSRLVLVEGAD